MTGVLLAVDPSLRAAGAALYRGGQLSGTCFFPCVDCGGEGRVRDCETCSQPSGERALRMAQEIAGWVAQMRAKPTAMAAEWPRIYRGHKSKADPNTQIGMAGVVSAVAGILAMHAAVDNRALELRTYLPSDWIGNLPKSKVKSRIKTSTRAKRILSRLEGDELRVWDELDTHDEVDAVGIGLHHLGRLHRRRVLPGATK